MTANKGMITVPAVYPRSFFNAPIKAHYGLFLNIDHFLHADILPLGERRNRNSVWQKCQKKSKKKRQNFHHRFYCNFRSRKRAIQADNTPIS